jgi:hypothetical protein
MVLVWPHPRHSLIGGNTTEDIAVLQHAAAIVIVRGRRHRKWNTLAKLPASAPRLTSAHENTSADDGIHKMGQNKNIAPGGYVNA